MRCDICFTKLTFNESQLQYQLYLSLCSGLVGLGVAGGDGKELALLCICSVSMLGNSKEGVCAILHP